MSFITKLLESIFPFLFSALKRAWDGLTTTQQQALVNAGTIGQFLKNNLTALGGDLVTAIANYTKLPTATVETTILALAAEFGLTTTDINQAVSYLQGKLQSSVNTPEWNGLLSAMLNVGATILSGGTLNWLHVALGLGEWVYQQFIQPLTGIALPSVVQGTPGATVTATTNSGSLPNA